jgi:RNA polymerase sigma-70 factor (ECF subfamily)
MTDRMQTTPAVQMMSRRLTRRWFLRALLYGTPAVALADSLWIEPNWLRIGSMWHWPDILMVARRGLFDLGNRGKSSLRSGSTRIATRPMNPTLTQQNRSPALGGAAEFVPTAWTLIVKAQQKDSPSCLQAMDTLCRAYWYPVYAFFRRQGCDSADAQDLTQELLTDLMSPTGLARVDRKRGRFRSYMLGAAKHLLAKRREQEGALKRGGRVEHVAIDQQDAEGRYLHEPQDLQTPETLLDYCWAQSVLAEALSRLQADYGKAGKAALFKDLRVFLEDDKGAVPYEAIAAQQQKSLSAVKTDIRRLRLRYGEKLREVVGETVAGPDDIDAELADLLKVLGQRGST